MRKGIIGVIIMLMLISTSFLPTIITKGKIQSKINEDKCNVSIQYSTEQGVVKKTMELSESEVNEIIQKISEIFNESKSKKKPKKKSKK